MADHYILEGKVTKPTDFMTWAVWFETADRVVAKTNAGDAVVSTVFLGLNHSFDESGPPLLFETMIFGGPHDEWCERCETWEQAEQLHQDAVALCSEDPTP